MEETIIIADASRRRFVLIAATIALTLCLAALAGLEHYLGTIKALAERDPQAAAEKATRVAVVVSSLSALGLVGMAGWFWLWARKIIQADRYPPPGTKVIRDTCLRTGPQARAMAHLAQATALLLAIAGTAGVWYLFHCLSMGGNEALAFRRHL